MRLIPWTLVVSASASESTTLAKSSVYACSSLVANRTWLFAGEAYYAAMCGYEPALGSWATCVNDFVETEAEQARMGVLAVAIELMDHHCSEGDASFEYAFTEERFFHSVYNASRFLEDDDLEGHTGVSPVRFNPDNRRLLGHAWLVSFRNRDFSDQSTMFLYSFLAFVTLASAVVHLFSGYLFKKTTINRIRSLVTIPTLREQHAQPLRHYPGGLLPTRLELVVVLGFLGVHALALCYRYEIDENEALDDLTNQWLKYIAFRTGILAFAQFPLIIFFSGRNSFFEYITGFHYTTSIVLHKWISRLMVFDALVHGGIFGIRAYIGGYLAEANKVRYWASGVAAIHAAVLLCILAFGVLRHRWYETFLVVHIVLASAFFYYAWDHVKKFGWTFWVYVSMAMWAFEKLMRAARVVAFGGVVTAQAQLHEPDIMRVAIPKPRRGWTTEPGQYIFLYFLFPSSFWQSHPFTFVDLGDKVVIVIKAKKGVTSTLLKRLRSSGGSTSVKVMVEGPYGESAPVSKYDGNLLMCGGSGIPGPLSYVLNTPKQNMRLVVVVRDFDIIRAFKNELSRIPESQLQIYVTSPPMTTYGSIEDPDWQEFPSLVRGRRPNVPVLIDEFMAANDSVAITCCGPPALVDSLRDTVAKALGESPTTRVGYFEEYQTW